MTSTTTSLPVLARLAAAADEVSALDLDRLTDDQLLELVRSVETAARRLSALDNVTVPQLQTRGLPGKHQARSVAVLLSWLLTLSPGEAAARAKRAAEQGVRPAVTGPALPPLLPAVASARAAGELTIQQADVIAAALRPLRDQVDAATVAEAELLLTEQATYLNSQELSHAARRLIDTIEPDGTGVDERERQQRRRQLQLVPIDGGMIGLQGELDPATGALARAVLQSLAAPRTSDGDRDDRSGGQRLHDAFGSVLKLAARAGQLPQSGGTPATVIITMTAAEFTAGTGLAETSFGQPLRVDDALRLAEEASIAWLVHNSSGQPLALGRTRRLATPAQTLALFARDRGCTFPGCTQPPEWTERHHIVPWRQGGLTELDNLCLLCDYHHDRIDSGGWIITMRDGRPWFIPPQWLDPAQVPRRNHRAVEITSRISGDDP